MIGYPCLHRAGPRRRVRNKLPHSRATCTMSLSSGSLRQRVAFMLQAKVMNITASSSERQAISVQTSSASLSVAAPKLVSNLDSVYLKSHVNIIIFY